MNRRNFLKISGVSAVSFIFSGCGKELQKSFGNNKPNVIMILVDDLGYGDLSCYGAEDLKTPNIDRLMSRGIRFNNFYANCPVCSPTRAALLSGRYPDMVGVPGVIRTHQKDSWGYLKEDTVLLPEILKKKAGYDTAIIGKWHLGLTEPNVPNSRGFDHFHGFLGDMMDDYWHHKRWGVDYMYLDKKKVYPEGHATDIFTDWTIDFINSRKGKSNPFFLYLAYNAPHTPIHPPTQWLEKVKQREKNITDRRAKLVALIEHLDEGIGRVIESLQKSGMADNTLVIFSSDNGGQVGVGANNGGLHGGKQDMWEGGIKEPFCAVWPEKIKPGLIDDHTVACTMDLYPTICHAAGVQVGHEIDGRSFLPLLEGRKLDWPDRYLVWVRREGNMRYGGRAYYAIRYGHWKLLQNGPFEPMQLFNLKEDPKEQNPLSGSHPIFKELYSELMNHINRSGGIPWAKEPVDTEKVYQGI